MDVNQDVVGFNPMPFIVAAVLIVACGVAYRRTRSWVSVGKAALWVVVGYVAFAVILHLVGFE